MLAILLYGDRASTKICKLLSMTTKTSRLKREPQRHGCFLLYFIKEDVFTDVCKMTHKTQTLFEYTIVNAEEATLE
jgi:hypothetical protein